MAKSPHKMPPTEADHTKLADQLKQIDPTSFLSDVTVALESFIDTHETKPEWSAGTALKTTLGPESCVEPSPETTVIYKKDGDYHVYFNTGEFSASWWGTNISAFTQWAMSLQSEEVVYFYQTGMVAYIPVTVQVMTVLDTLCKAKKIFVVDHMIESPLFLFVCDEVCIEELGAICFRSCVDPTTASIPEKTFLPYLRRLYDRGVARNLLTTEEATAILMDNRIVFKTARELRAQRTVAT
jgi:hypothetical protein